MRASGAAPVRWLAPALDQLSYLLRHIANQQLHAVIQFDGYVDIERLCRAVHLTLMAEPILGCRFVVHPHLPTWEQRTDVEHLTWCTIESPSDPNASLLDFMTKIPMDPASDPLVHVRVIRASTDTVCIKLCHLAGDAAGLRDYVRLLSTIYTTIGTTPSFTPIPNMTGDRSLRQVLQHFSMGTLVAAARMSYAPPPVWGFPSVPGDTTDHAIVLHTISAEPLRALRVWGREHGLTLNDLLLTAFYRALFAIIDPPYDSPWPVQATIDLRRYLPSGKASAICNLSSGLYPTIMRQPNDSFADTAARVHRTMVSIKAQTPGIGSALGFLLSFRRGFAHAQHALLHFFEQQIAQQSSHPLLTNMGMLRRDDVLFDGLHVVNAYLVGTVVLPPGLMVGVTTFDDILTISVGICPNTTPISSIRELLGSMERELLAPL